MLFSYLSIKYRKAPIQIYSIVMILYLGVTSKKKKSLFKDIIQKKKSLFKDIIQINVDHPPSYPIFDKLFFDKF